MEKGSTANMWRRSRIARLTPILFDIDMVVGRFVPRRKFTKDEVYHVSRRVPPRSAAYMLYLHWQQKKQWAQDLPKIGWQKII
jgi:hypothetical protein